MKDLKEFINEKILINKDSKFTEMFKLTKPSIGFGDNKTKNICWEIANNEFTDPNWYDSHEDMIEQIQQLAKTTGNDLLMNKVYELIDTKLGEEFDGDDVTAIDRFFIEIAIQLVNQF